MTRCLIPVKESAQILPLFHKNATNFFHFWFNKCDPFNTWQNDFRNRPSLYVINFLFHSDRYQHNDAMDPSTLDPSSIHQWSVTLVILFKCALQNVTPKEERTQQCWLMTHDSISKVSLSPCEFESWLNTHHHISSSNAISVQSVPKFMFPIKIFAIDNHSPTKKTIILRSPASTIRMNAGNVSDMHNTPLCIWWDKITIK